VEDTHFYDLLLRLSLLPVQDWRAKIDSLRTSAFHDAAPGAAVVRLPLQARSLPPVPQTLPPPRQEPRAARRSASCELSAFSGGAAAEGVSPHEPQRRRCAC